jgi:hypothetical protein
MASIKGVLFLFEVLACLCFFSLSQGAGLSSSFRLSMFQWLCARRCFFGISAFRGMPLLHIFSEQAAKLITLTLMIPPLQCCTSNFLSFCFLFSFQVVQSHSLAWVPFIVQYFSCGFLFPVIRLCFSETVARKCKRQGSKRYVRRTC